MDLLLYLLLLLLYVLLVPAREASIAEFDAHGVKNAWTLIGTMCGLMLAWWMDDKRTHFETKAVWWAQACKLIIGLGLIIALRMGLKALFYALFDGAVFTDAVRYFLMAVTGGVLWPMTFRFWAKLGAKQGGK